MDMEARRTVHMGMVTVHRMVHMGMLRRTAYMGMEVHRIDMAVVVPLIDTEVHRDMEVVVHLTDMEVHHDMAVVVHLIDMEVHHDMAVVVHLTDMEVHPTGMATGTRSTYTTRSHTRKRASAWEV